MCIDSGAELLEIDPFSEACRHFCSFRLIRSRDVSARASRRSRGKSKRGERGRARKGEKVRLTKTENSTASDESNSRPRQTERKGRREAVTISISNATGSAEAARDEMNWVRSKMKSKSRRSRSIATQSARMLRIAHT